jgi:hypothetical protein
LARRVVYLVTGESVPAPDPVASVPPSRAV